MHGFQAVANVGQSAAHDHAHRVIEIAAFHFIEDRDGFDISRSAGRGPLVNNSSGNGKRSLTPQSRRPGLADFTARRQRNRASIAYNNLGRFQGIIEIVRARRPALSIKAFQSTVRRKLEGRGQGKTSSQVGIASVTGRKGWSFHRQNWLPKALGGLLLLGGADKPLSRAPARGDPAASACIHRARGQQSLWRASPRSTVPGPRRRRTRSRSTRS